MATACEQIPPFPPFVKGGRPPARATRWAGRGDFAKGGARGFRTRWCLALALWLAILVPASAQSADPPNPTADTAAGTSTRHPRTAERLTGLPGLTNVARVAPGIYRGAQPQPSGYATLKKLGVRTVINLRARHSEKAAVEAAGMRSIEVPIRIPGTLTAEAMRRVVADMADPNNQPVFVHCAQGRDRTGVAVAVYRMEMDRWSNAEAEAEMQAFGFNHVWIHLKRFVRNYRVEGATPRHVRPDDSPATP